MKRSRKRLGAVDVTLDPERLTEMRERAGVYKRAADKIVEAACRVSQRGDAWGYASQKVFLADLAAELDVPMKRLAPIVASSNALGWLELARADLAGAMDPKKLDASEVVVGRNARFHFLVIDPKKCRRR